MDVKLDDEILFSIDDIMLKLLAHDLDDPIEEIKRRLKYIIEHKCDMCFQRLNDEYLPKLENDPDIHSIPKSKRDRVNLICQLPYYKNKQQRNNQSDNTNSI